MNYIKLLSVQIIVKGWLIVCLELRFLISFLFLLILYHFLVLKWVLHYLALQTMENCHNKQVLSYQNRIYCPTFLFNWLKLYCNCLDKFLVNRFIIQKLLLAQFFLFFFIVFSILFLGLPNFFKTMAKLV